jgi:hypothetical protein
MEKPLVNKYIFLFFITICLFYVLLGFLDWQPSGEVYAKWQSAAMLKKDGEHSVSSIPLIYSLYLQFFLLFEFPFSVQIEHLITTLFGVYSIYYFVKSRFGFGISIFFCLAWAPVIWDFESGSRMLGIAFLLFHMGSKSNILSKGFFPIFLVLATLFEPAYFFILLINLLIQIFKFSKERYLFNYMDKLQVVFLFFIGLIIFSSISNQSEAKYNNAYQFEYPWAPIELNGSMNVSVLQIVTDQLAKRDTDEEDWYKQDWFFTYPKYFGSAKNLSEAFFRYPKIFFQHMENQIWRAKSAPSWLLFGPHLTTIFYENYSKVGLLLISYLILLNLIYINFKSFLKSGDKDIFIYLFGASPILIAILLTHPSFRYVFVLFPISLYLLVNAKHQIWLLRRPIFLILFTLIIVFSNYGHHFFKNNNLDGPYFQHFDYSANGPELLKRVSENTRILSTKDAAWIKTFSDASHENIFEIFYLPPFKDDTNETVNFLRGLDEVWIHKDSKIKSSSISTQEYLRYELHLMPFEKNYKELGFRKIDILNYGEVYAKD